MNIPEVERFLGTLRQANNEKRHTTVNVKTHKRGWSNVEEPGKIVIQTMLLYNSAPYTRNKHQKTFKLSDPDLFPKIEKWWNQNV